MNILKEGAEHFGLCVSNEQVSAFERYKKLLIKWNQKVNLTAITDEDNIEIRHFLDSLSVVSVMDNYREGNRLIDIGSGAGFPGLPVKIMLNGLSLTLMDSIGKKIAFLQEVINELNIKNATVIHSRAEDLANDSDFREKFDYVTARGVSKLNVLSEYCLPFVKLGGKFISMKVSDADYEINEAKASISALGGEISRIKKVKIPFSDITHSLIVIDKVSITPFKYPRKAGKALKKPIT